MMKAECFVIMNIVDLKSQSRAVLEQAAEILMADFKPHYPDAWPDMEAARAEVKRAFDPNRIGRVALNEDGKTLGWIGAIPEYGGKAWNIHPLVVDPAHQGQGVGRALVTDMERLVRAQGAITLFFGTDDEDNQTSLGGIDVYPDVLTHIQNIKNINRHPYEFYQNLGFVIVGIIPDANGFGKPDILMAKRVGK